MAILHRQVLIQRKVAGGVQLIPPPSALQQQGPTVQVTISVAESVVAQLAEKGLEIPAPVSGLALIDTGASTTCIDNDVAQQIGAPVVDVVKMASASHAETEANMYPIRLEVVGLLGTVSAPRAMGAALQCQGLIALIGRDVLRRCTLHYNGPSGEFTLAI